MLRYAHIPFFGACRNFRRSRKCGKPEQPRQSLQEYADSPITCRTSPCPNISDSHTRLGSLIVSSEIATYLLHLLDWIEHSIKTHSSFETFSIQLDEIPISSAHMHLDTTAVPFLLARTRLSKALRLYTILGFKYPILISAGQTPRCNQSFDSLAKVHISCVPPGSAALPTEQLSPLQVASILRSCYPPDGEASPTHSATLLATKHTLPMTPARMGLGREHRTGC